VAAPPQFSHDDHLLGPFVSGSKIWLLRCHSGVGLRVVADRELGFVPFRACTDELGRWLALVAYHSTSIVDLARGCELAVLPLPGNLPLRFDPAGHALWTAGDDGLLRWPMHPDSTNPNNLRVGPPERLSKLTSFSTWGASKDGTVVSIPQFDKGTLVLNCTSGSVLRLAPQNDVRDSAVSPDKRWVATATHTAQNGWGAKVWEAGTGRQVSELPVSGLCQVSFSPDGKWLVTTGGGCRIWEVGTWREGPQLGSNNGTCVFSADGSILALGDRTRIVRLVSPQTGHEIVRLTVPDETRLSAQSFSPDGAQLAVVGTETQLLYLFDLRAIRWGLNALDLNWDAPPLPPPRPTPSEPSRLLVDLGDFRNQGAAVRMIWKSDELIQWHKDAQALAALRIAVATDPSNAMAHNLLAWQLLMGPQDLLDPKAAVALARRAVELAPDVPECRNTLGLALYRNGQFKDAVGVLERSPAAGKGQGQAFDFFVLSMCKQRLGDKDAAKARYEQAVKWFQEERDRLSPEHLQALTSFQAEAEAELSRP
jgi:Tfp pilus assembly protein PilF